MRLKSLQLTVLATLTPLLFFAQQPKSAPAPEAAELEALDLYRPGKPIPLDQAPARIAFGSCNKMDYSQSILNTATSNNPDLWIWLGDIVYADTTDIRALAKAYKALKKSPEYQNMLSKVPVIGIWDDHDYGMNDGDKNHPTKIGAKRVLMDFLDVPRNAEVRKREGAYQSYTFGKGAQSIKIILMDTRYFRDELKPDPSKRTRYLPNTQGDILGEAQWAWLERELAGSKANMHILCSSIQVLPVEQPFEKWANFPNARKRLLDLIVRNKPNNLLILSGDRHMAEISRMDIIGLPYPLYEFTSSGLTHTRPNDAEPNKYRKGNMIVKRNFGLLEISWADNKPVVVMQVRGGKNELCRQEVVKY